MTKIYLGRLATTHTLSNGFAHTRDALVQFAEDINAGIASGEHQGTHVSHRTEKGPVGKTLRAWVDQMEDDPTHWALFCEYEFPDNSEADPLTMGLSLAFFGNGIGLTTGGTETITVGVPAGGLSHNEMLVLLHELSSIARMNDIVIRDYYQHSMEGLAKQALVFVFKNVGSSLFRKSGEAISNWIAQRLLKIPVVADRVNRVQISARTQKGKVEISIPFSASTSETVQHSIDRAFSLIEMSEEAKVGLLVGYEFSVDGQPHQVYENPLVDQPKALQTPNNPPHSTDPSV